MAWVNETKNDATWSQEERPGIKYKGQFGTGVFGKAKFGVKHPTGLTFTNEVKNSANYDNETKH